MNNKVFLTKKIITEGDEKISFSSFIEHLNIRNVNKKPMNSGGLWSISTMIPSGNNFRQVCRNDYLWETLTEFTTNELHYFNEKGEKCYLMIKGEELYDDKYDFGSDKKLINSFRYRHASGDVYETQIVPCNDFARLNTLPKAILSTPAYKFDTNIAVTSVPPLFITDCLDIYDGQSITNYRFDFVNNKIYQGSKFCDYIIFLSREKITYKLTLLNGYFAIAVQKDLESYTCRWNDGGEKKANIIETKIFNEVTSISYITKDKDNKEIICRAMIIPNLKKY